MSKNPIASERKPRDLLWLVAAVPFLLLVVFTVQGSVEVRSAPNATTEVLIDGKAAPPSLPGVYRSGFKLIGPHAVTVRAAGRPELQTIAFVWLSQRVVVDASAVVGAGGASGSASEAATGQPVERDVRGDGRLGVTSTAATVDEPTANAFVRTYLSALNGKGADEIASLYGDAVEYYGAGRVGHDYIRLDKERFYARWPEVRYTLDGAVVGPVTGDGHRQVTLETTFQVSNRQGVGRRGRARTTLELVSRAGGPVIVKESQQVLERVATRE